LCAISKRNLENNVKKKISKNPLMHTEKFPDVAVEIAVRATSTAIIKKAALLRDLSIGIAS